MSSQKVENLFHHYPYILQMYSSVELSTILLSEESIGGETLPGLKKMEM